MDWILTLFFRWRDRRRPQVHLRWLGDRAAHGAPDFIDFPVALTNDGTMIARGVIVRGYLGGEQVTEAAPIDVPTEAEPVTVNVRLQHPQQADLEPRLAMRPIFHGRIFTVRAFIGEREVGLIVWPHEEEPPLLDRLTPEEEANQMRHEFMRGLDERAERREPSGYEWV